MKSVRYSRAENTARLHSAIVRWFRSDARALPWRRTRDPYKILVSEVMLQQTQVSRVQKKYKDFLKRFPSFRALARSTPAEVIRAWRGMGYNNRAIRIRSLAQIVDSQYNGKLPETAEGLLKLPGIGRYTAHAVACFAFGKRVPVVDTNIRRVLMRLFPASKADIWDLAERNLPVRSPYEWNQGLMELGATICKSSSPRCSDCPVNRYCPSAYKPVHRVPRSLKAEPGRGGIPNRIFRGRIVEVLRERKRNPLDLVSVGRLIKADFSHNDRPWLKDLVKGLERDGLVTTFQRGSGIAVKLAS